MVRLLRFAVSAAVRRPRAAVSFGNSWVMYDLHVFWMNLRTAAVSDFVAAQNKSRVLSV